MLINRKKFQSVTCERVRKRDHSHLTIEIFSNKKASLEISIQAIIIVVLAMTLLGLGLGFIRGMFKNITSTTEDVTEQVRQKILDDLITGDKKISFPKSEVVIERGDSEILTVGIRNKKGTGALNYKIIFTAVSDPDGNLFSIDSPAWFHYAQPQNGYLLPAGEADVRSIRLNIPRNVQSGSYVLTFDVLDIDFSSGDPLYIYGQKDFFIVVRG